MKIEALIPFTMRDSSTGELTSIGCGQVVTVDSTLGNSLITDGLAKEFTLITPTGSKNITTNGTVDVTTYASVVVNVAPVTLTYDANGGTGSVSPAVVGAGSSVTLSDGTGLTAPTDKAFGGWGESSSATEAITSPLVVTANKTIYAIWVDAT